MKIIIDTLSLTFLVSTYQKSNFCVAQESLDTNGFGTATEIFVSLMLQPIINIEIKEF